MAWFKEVGRRIESVLRRKRLESDLAEEMRLHLELRQQEHENRGVAPDKAGAAARLNFGNVTILREVSGDAWGWRTAEYFAQDLRYGARSLLRTPGFTVVAVVALALGIGANTAIFSVVNAVLLRPLAYKDPDRLVTLLHDGSNPVAPANYLDWRQQSRSFEAMGAGQYWTPNLTNNNSPEHLLGLQVTQSLLPMMGVQPLLGRTFAVGEDQKGSEREVVLSYRLWQRRFGGDGSVLGKPIMLDGTAYNIVGVMPAGFRFAPFWATGAELWVPLALGDRVDDRGGSSLRVFGRLKPGAGLAQARAEIATVTARLERQYPGTNRGVVVTPLKEKVTGKIETPLLLLLGAVGFVLLIACANVAHMLLARTADREKEIAVRTALGAGRARVISQFLTEDLLLAAMGAVAGLALAEWGIKALVALSPAYLPRVETIRIDGGVLLFLLGVTVVTSLVFGLAPAMHAAAGNLSRALKEGGRAGSDGVRRSRLRSFLVASEFALAFVLLTGAGLMIRSFSALQSVDPGFNPNQVVSMVVSVAGSKEAEPERRALFYRELLQRVRAVPGVISAGAINHLPLAGDMWGLPFAIEGCPKPRPGDEPSAVYRLVMPGYFETMRLPLLRGRPIGEGDHAGAQGVAIVNERAARLYWPGEDPVGKHISFGPGTTSAWLTIVGVAKNAKQKDWTAASDPEVYLAASQTRDFLEDHGAYITLVARTSGNAADMAAPVQQAVWSLDRNLPISDVLTMDRAVADATAEPRFETLLLGVFGAVALALAAVGIYGVMNYAVSRRKHEIGIRISLGAGRLDVLRMVVRQGMTQALTGSAVGVVAALLLAQLMAKMLFGVRPTDVATFCGVAVVLGVVALLATCVPARRATRIDPIAALRNE